MNDVFPILSHVWHFGMLLEQSHVRPCSDQSPVDRCGFGSSSCWAWATPCIGSSGFKAPCYIGCDAGAVAFLQAGFQCMSRYGSSDSFCDLFRQNGHMVALPMMTSMTTSTATTSTVDCCICLSVCLFFSFLSLIRAAATQEREVL